LQNDSFDNIIISDTSCLIALNKISKLDVLNQLYKKIFITPEVASEYKNILPEWILIKEVKNKKLIAEFRKNNFGMGESTSIALAMEKKNSLLILDEDRARNFARKLGLPITGTLSVIGKACDLGYIKSYEKTCEDLKKVNFRFTKKIQEEAKKNTISRKGRDNSP
jgi:predicted nucleic acid-binding protein